MDRAQLLLVGLPLFLFFSDIINLFTPPPPKPPPHHHHHHHPHQQPQPKPQSAPLDFPTQKESGIGGIGFGNTVNINFCSSCSYRGNAVTMKNMLENQFPGVTVVLANYPPPLPKRLLSKVVPVVQIGVIGIVMAGEQIFPRLGFIAPPPWYYSLRANRFGTISTTWLLGNFLQSFLQSSGAFEVYCNGELVFSKLKQQRFPGEIELKDLVGQRLVASRIVDDVGAGVWSQPL
ncbi:selT-like protein [Vitis riparia]|uniref:selT-like protein n=1 Tax=Vitis riparia TaxID=96939 RepID=UPI00155A6695|nr:selT-like protein [Vitis riparia]